MERTVTEQFVSANIFEVTIHHNGYCGGDSGHGGFVEIYFKNIAGTDMSINGNKCEDFTLKVQGDCERDTLIWALSMIVSELKTHNESTHESCKEELPF